MSEVAPGMSYEALAESAYKAYVASLGPTAELPPWHRLELLTRIAWECSARQLYRCFERSKDLDSNIRLEAPDETDWCDFVPPQYKKGH